MTHATHTHSLFPFSIHRHSFLWLATKVYLCSNKHIFISFSCGVMNKVCCHLRNRHIPVGREVRYIIHRGCEMVPKWYWWMLNRQINPRLKSMSLWNASEMRDQDLFWSVDLRCRISKILLIDRKALPPAPH